MKQGFIEVFCGTGKGKTSMAIGQSLRTCAEHKRVIIIQFLKGKDRKELCFLEDTDVDVKLFCFEKTDVYFDELSEQEKGEQRQNIRNGLQYARKVIATHECDLLVLDEILGLPENRIATCEEINEILRKVTPNMHVIMTGRDLNEDLLECVSSITRIETEILQETI